MMKKFLFSAVMMVPMTGLAAPPIQGPMQAPQAPHQAPPKAMAQAPMQAPMQSPVQAPMQAPNKMATAPQTEGYRSFSYEPSLQPAVTPMNYGYYGNVGPYNDFGPYNNARRGYRSGPERTGFYDAGYKVRGDW